MCGACLTDDDLRLQGTWFLIGTMDDIIRVPGANHTVHGWTTNEHSELGWGEAEFEPSLGNKYAVSMYSVFKVSPCALSVTHVARHTMILL